MFTQTQKDSIIKALDSRIEEHDGHEPFTSDAVSAAQKVIAGDRNLTDSERVEIQQGLFGLMMFVVEEEDGEEQVAALACIQDMV